MHCCRHLLFIYVRILTSLLRACHTQNTFLYSDNKYLTFNGRVHLMCVLKCSDAYRSKNLQ